MDLTRRKLLLALSASALLAGCVRVDSPEASQDARGGDRPPSILIYLEAEAGVLTPPFRRMSDPAASGGAYLLDAGPAGTASAGGASYSFTLPRSGAFYLWGRVRATGDATDSFIVAIDGGQQAIFHTTIPGYPADWRWKPLGIEIASTLTKAELELGGGQHELALSSREAQAMVDRLLFTDDPGFVP